MNAFAHIDDLADLYVVSRWAYAQGAESITNKQYDELHKTLLETGEISEYTSRTWSEDPCPTRILVKYNLHYLIKTFVPTKDKIYTSSMMSLISIFEFWKIFSDRFVRSQLTYKYDGWNIQIHYVNGVLVTCETRGRADGSIPRAVTHKNVPTRIPIMGDVFVIGELYLSDVGFSNLLKKCPELTSQRASVSSAIARGYTDFLDICAFSLFENGVQRHADEVINLLNDIGFKTSLLVEYFDKAEDVLDTIQNGLPKKSSLGIPTDGLVLRNVETNTCVALRFGDWAQEVLHSYIVDYYDSYSDIYISQEVDIYPIFNAGSTFRRIPVTNIQRLITLDLEIGSPIAFSVTSSAVGVLDEIVTRSLQKRYACKYETYKKEIEDAEADKKFIRTVLST